MIASAHVAAGVVAGMGGAYLPVSRILRIVAAFSLGILSHVVLDAIPHSDYRMVAPSAIVWVALCETVAIGASAGYLLRHRLIPHWPGYLLAGLAGSNLPDAKFAAIAMLPESIAQSVERYGDAFHSPFHASPMSEPLLGLGIEVACTVVLLAALTTFPRVLARSDADLRDRSQPNRSSSDPRLT